MLLLTRCMTAVLKVGQTSLGLDTRSDATKTLILNSLSLEHKQMDRYLSPSYSHRIRLQISRQYRTLVSDSKLIKRIEQDEHTTSTIFITRPNECILTESRYAVVIIISTGEGGLARVNDRN